MMGGVAAGRPRGGVVSLLLSELVFGGERLASELSLVAGVPSRWVYPLLRYWVGRGVVIVEKAGSLNLYRVDRSTASRLRGFLESLLRSREALTVRRVLAAAARRLGRRLTGAEAEVLALLAERLARGKPYLRVSAPSREAAVDIIAARLEARLRARGLDPARIASMLAQLPDALQELAEEGLVYAHWDERRRTLVLRIDTGLEREALGSPSPG